VAANKLLRCSLVAVARRRRRGFRPGPQRTPRQWTALTDEVTTVAANLDADTIQVGSVFGAPTMPVKHHGADGDEDVLGKNEKGGEELYFSCSRMKIETQATLRVLPSFIDIHEHHSIHSIQSFRQRQRPCWP